MSGGRLSDDLVIEKYIHVQISLLTHYPIKIVLFSYITLYYVRLSNRKYRMFSNGNAYTVIFIVILSRCSIIEIESIGTT